MWYEVPHICHHANETGQLLLICMRGHLCDTLDLLGTGVYAITAVFSSED